MIVRRPLALATAAVVSATSQVHAQIRASERGAVSQTVDGTMITVDYARPQARGRDSLFGKVVTLDETWTPGANQATTLRVSRDVTIGGKPLPAGKYSVWLTLVPGAWKLHLHPDTTLYHTRPPKLDAMLLSIPVTPVRGERVEVLTFDFPRVWAQGTELRLRWGTTIVPIAIGVQPSSPNITMSKEQLDRYLGTYSVTFPDGDHRSAPRRLAIVEAKGRLRAVLDDENDPIEMEFLPTMIPDHFMPAFLDKGQIFDVDPMPVVFQIEGKRAVGFTVGEGKDPWMVATRRQ